MSTAREIEECAALWVLRREEPYWSDDEQEELDRWLAESDAHKAAFWRLEHGWREADRIASLGALPSPPERRFDAVSWWKPFAVAASLLFALAIFTLRAPGLPFDGAEQVQEVRFETAIGGRRLVSLSDGSRMELNTDTAIRAAIGDRQRRVWLERGEAFFSVAKHSGREFIIYAGPRTIRVMGTKFSVRRDGADLVVAVVEGRVRLDEGSGETERSTTLNGGHVAVASQRSTTVSTGTAEEVQGRLAWRDGLLQFDGSTLADAAKEFNRYNRRQLIIQGEAAARIRIGGSFDARNVDGFARLLENAYGLKLQQEGDRILVST